MVGQCAIFGAVGSGPRMPWLSDRLMRLGAVAVGRASLRALGGLYMSVAGRPARCEGCSNHSCAFHRSCIPRDVRLGHRPDIVQRLHFRVSDDAMALCSAWDISKAWSRGSDSAGDVQGLRNLGPAVRGAGSVRFGRCASVTACTRSLSMCGTEVLLHCHTVYRLWDSSSVAARGTQGALGAMSAGM